MKKYVVPKILVFISLVILFTSLLFSYITTTRANEENEIFNNQSKILYIKEDCLAYTDINKNIEDYSKILYLGNEISVTEESNNFYNIGSKTEPLYIQKIYTQESNPLTHINLIYYSKEKIFLYEQPSTLSNKIETNNWNEFIIVGEIGNFYKVNIDDYFYYVNKDNLYDYDEIFKTCEKDVYILENLYSYTSPSKEIKLVKLEKGIKIRVIEESDDFLVFNYNNRKAYIEKTSEIISSNKVFTKSNDKVITINSTKIYSSMNQEGQYLLEIPKDTVLNRIYYGTKGYDIVLMDNVLGYAPSENIAPVSNVIIENRTTGYLKETTNLYDDSSLKETNQILLAGTKLYIINESNNLAKVTDGEKVGFISSSLIVSEKEAFFITNVIKYTNTDVIFNYIENNKEYSTIIPKGMFVLQKETSYAGIDKIEFDGHIGTINTAYLNDSCEISSEENFMSYKSDTLEVKITRHNENGTVYWISEIITEDASKQLKCGLSYGDYGGKRQTTSSQVSDNNGIIGINGSGFWYNDGTIYGNIVIKNSKIIKDGYGENHLMCIDKNGKIFSAPDPSSANDLLNLGVVNTFGFGPMLIIDGKDVRDIETGNYPRTGIGMIEPGHYILVTADGKRPKSYSKGLTLTKLTQIFEEYNVEYAYNLDGGGSTTLTFLGEVINIPSDGSERACADTIYFID